MTLMVLFLCLCVCYVLRGTRSTDEVQWSHQRNSLEVFGSNWPSPTVKKQGEPENPKDKPDTRKPIFKMHKFHSQTLFLPWSSGQWFCCFCLPSGETFGTEAAISWVFRQGTHVSKKKWCNWVHLSSWGVEIAVFRVAICRQGENLLFSGLPLLDSSTATTSHSHSLNTSKVESLFFPKNWQLYFSVVYLFLTPLQQNSGHYIPCPQPENLKSRVPFFSEKLATLLFSGLPLLDPSTAKLRPLHPIPTAWKPQK